MSEEPKTLKCLVCEQMFNPREVRFTDNLRNNTVEIRCKPCFRGEGPVKPTKSKGKKKAKKDEPKDSGITLTEDDLVTE